MYTQDLVSCATEELQCELPPLKGQDRATKVGSAATAEGTGFGKSIEVGSTIMAEDAGPPRWAGKDHPFQKDLPAPPAPSLCSQLWDLWVLFQFVQGLQLSTTVLLGPLIPNVVTWSSKEREEELVPSRG